jgi:hypothetical protein
MLSSRPLLSLAATLLLTAAASAESIRGQYLEARTCDIYTGPCFANAEIGLAGSEAMVAWKIEEGDWQGTRLDGLCVAVVLKADNTLGDDGVFPMAAEGIKSVILVDDRGSAEQREALEGFARENASRYVADVQQVTAVPMSLENDHDRGRGRFVAGKLAQIETRAMAKLDCVCTNEMVYYQPLTEVKFASPVYALTQSYKGDGLDGRWTLNSTRSAFLGTFRR